MSGEAWERARQLIEGVRQRVDDGDAETIGRLKGMSDAVTAINVSGARIFWGSNTYHSARVYVEYGDGLGVRTFYAPFQYGYGEQYEESAAEVLEKAGVIVRKVYSNGAGAESLRRYCEAHGIAYSSRVRDEEGRQGRRRVTEWGQP